MITDISKAAERSRTNRRIRTARTWPQQRWHETELRYRKAKRTLTFTAERSG